MSRSQEASPGTLTLELGLAANLGDAASHACPGAQAVLTPLALRLSE